MIPLVRALLLATLLPAAARTGDLPVTSYALTSGNDAAGNEFALLRGKPMRGWAIRTGVNPWGADTFLWDKTANAWLLQHVWEHYAFSGDKVYLKNTAYPMMKEIVEFWEDHLKALPDGRLVVPYGLSPEHGPEEDGTSYNQEIVWDLFTNYLEAADALGVDQVR